MSWIVFRKLQALKTLVLNRKTDRRPNHFLTKSGSAYLRMNRKKYLTNPKNGNDARVRSIAEVQKIRGVGDYFYRGHHNRLFL